MNIILTSTEHTFPDSLRDLGFNPLDITRFIFPGEVTPDKAYELLTQRWGVGPNLAVALIDHYGGNLYNIQQKLNQLNSQGETFFAASQEQADGVLDCLECDVIKIE